MTTVVGLTPGEHGGSVLHLGAMLARSRTDDLTVAVVVPTPWPPNPYRADLEFQALQEQQARHALEQARGTVGPGLALRLRLHRARSVPSGLLEVLAEEAATSVVLGSTGAGVLGRVSLGGVAERVLHSSEVPVTLAPAGFQSTATARVARVSVGYGRADRDSDLLATATRLADQLGAPLRVACFAVRPLAYGGSIEPAAEGLVVDEWRRAVEAEVEQAAGGPVETVVGQGSSWPEAVTAVGWTGGDLLAVGGRSSPVSRFFLGSHAAKIVRSATVPVTLLPRTVR